MRRDWIGGSTELAFVLGLDDSGVRGHLRTGDATLRGGGALWRYRRVPLEKGIGPKFRRIAVAGINPSVLERPDVAERLAHVLSKPGPAGWPLKRCSPEVGRSAPKLLVARALLASRNAGGRPVRGALHFGHVERADSRRHASASQRKGRPRSRRLGSRRASTGAALGPRRLLAAAAVATRPGSGDDLGNVAPDRDRRWRTLGA